MARSLTETVEGCLHSRTKPLYSGQECVGRRCRLCGVNLFRDAAGYTAGLLAGLEWAYSQDTLCCHVYGTPTDAVSKAIAHVKATGELPGEARA